MPSTRPDPGRNDHHAGLILRVVRGDGHAEEFYLAAGLSIGRSMANTVVLADDESIDRTHARVVVDDDGCASLRCVELQSSLATAAGLVRVLRLEAGVTFQVGRVEFQCVPGLRQTRDDGDWASSSCPFCGSRAVALAGEGARPCPGCCNPLLPVLFDPHDPVPLLVPVAYGRYRATRYVARGGMGLVLKGKAGDDGEPVAVKVLLNGEGNERRGQEGFNREVEMMARVRSPFVVRLLDHGKAGRYRYLILEWIEGSSLRQRIADANNNRRRARFEKSLDWIERICKGVAAVHAVGVIHRDIKPGNILIRACYELQQN